MANKDIKFLQEQTDGSFLEVNVAATADSLLSFSNTSEPEAVLKSIFVTGAPWQSEGYVTGTPWTSEGYVVNSGTVPLTSDEMAWYVNASVVMTAGNIGQYAYTGDGSAFATAAQGALADTAVQGTPWQSEGYYVGDGSAFATAAQGALADSAVQGAPWQSEGYVVADTQTTYSLGNQGLFNIAGVMWLDNGQGTGRILDNRGIGTSTISVDPNLRILCDQYGNTVVDWVSRQLCYGSTPTVVASWADGTLKDGSGNAFVVGAPWQSEGFYIGDGSAFATAAQGSLADTAVQGTPWQSEGYVTGTPWQSEGYYVGDGSAFATAAQGSAADTAYGWGDHSQAGYSTFNPNQAGSLENSSGIFDGGALTNGVSIGGGFVRLVLYNLAGQLTVLDGGTKQLIGYADYNTTPTPLVAACWSDGILREVNGQPFIRENPVLVDVFDRKLGVAQTVTGSGFTDAASNTTFTRCVPSTMANPLSPCYVNSTHDRWFGYYAGGNCWYVSPTPAAAGAFAYCATLVGTYTGDAGAIAVDVAQPIVADWSTGTLKDGTGNLYSVAKVLNLLDQGADITQTTIAGTTTAGLYRVSYYGESPVGGATAGDVTCAFRWIDKTTERTVTSGTLNMVILGDFVSGTFIAYCSDATGISYLATNTDIYDGGATFDLRIVVEKLS